MYVFSFANNSIATSFDDIVLEGEIGLTSYETFENFKRSCERYRHELMKLLNEIKSQGNSIAGYAATSKSSTIIKCLRNLKSDVKEKEDE